MSNSKLGPRAFLLYAMLGAITCVLAAVLLTAIGDPSGVSKGDKKHGAGPFESAPRLVLDRRPTAILLGNSRVIRGFDHHDFPEGTINLGHSAVALPGVILLLNKAMKSPDLQKVWLGIDFGMFCMPDQHRQEFEFELNRDQDPTWASRLGAIRPSRIRAALLDAAGLSNPESKDRDPDGFQKPGRRPVNIKAGQALTPPLLAQHAAITGTIAQERYQERLNMLTAALQKLAARNVQVNLFINPSHPLYFEALEKLEILDDYKRMQVDIEQIVDQIGDPHVSLIDFSTRYARTNLLPGESDSSLDSDPPFYDLVHYQPSVGKEIRNAFPVQQDPQTLLSK
ncbi:hypothetical protein [Lignipirellula cremea]|uniref:Uncharacterized protein n=1 Tax=Lignipirellula cremea TaxID=2528010 RepID=A0A518E0T1_9BACT|nr:hypothetical protein [Lignipirellula cremea]QDU97671.1 hypothetical protein Pla8534_55230 [Lignipirellula cremea]